MRIVSEVPLVVIPETVSGKGGRFKHLYSIEQPVSIKIIRDDQTVPWVKRTIAECAKSPVIVDI